MAFRKQRDRRNYDDKRPVTPSIRSVRTAGKVIEVGQELPHEITDFAFRQRMWASGRLDYLDEHEPVKVEEPVETVEAKTAEDTVERVIDEKAQKAVLIEAIENLGGKATMGKKLENLKAQLEELGGNVEATLATLASEENPDDEETSEAEETEPETGTESETATDDATEPEETSGDDDTSEDAETATDDDEADAESKTE